MTKLVGYHYTSYDNWMSIEQDGLLPYPMPSLQELAMLKQTFKRGIKGIWLWREKLLGQSHIGTVIYQATTRPSTKIVMLEVSYRSEDLLRVGRRIVTTKHDGQAGNWVYHTHEPAVIVVKPIPPRDVRLVRVFDLMELLAA